MKTLHAFPTRAEAKRHLPRRQLPPLAALFAAVVAIGLAFSPRAAAADVAEELRVAKLMETALFLRQAKPEELRKMERFYEELAQRYPADATVKNAQAEWFWNTESPEQAVKTWLAAEKIDPRNATVLDHLGGAFLARGEAKRAASYYARATECAPTVAEYHHSYANVAFLFRHELLDAARPDAAAVLRDALAHFAEAARLAPLNPEYARAYAETFYLVPDADWAAALQAWQRVYEISPLKDFTLLNMARVQMKLGDKTAARASLARIQNPEFSSVKTRLEERMQRE